MARAPYEESLRKDGGIVMKKVYCVNGLRARTFGADPSRRAPGFCLIDTKGQWQDLADYRGKVVLVEFMQTDLSAHCATFSTVLNGLKMKYGDKLAILAVANPPDNPQTMHAVCHGA